MPNLAGNGPIGTGRPIFEGHGFFSACDRPDFVAWLSDRPRGPLRQHNSYQDEPNVGRRPEPTFLVTLTMVAVLAWPWNVTLSAAEAFATRPAEGPAVASKHSSRKAARMPRVATPLIQTILLDDSEEDAAGSPHLSSGFLTSAPEHGPTARTVVAVASAQILGTRHAARLYRLRC